MVPERLNSKERTDFAVEKILVAGNRGPCAGVNMALDAADQILDIVDRREDVYSLWDIVHNKAAMADFEKRGLVSVNYDLGLVPDKAVVMKPAHGGPPWLDRYAQEHNWHFIDVTCLLVNKNQDAIRADTKSGKKSAILGVEGHPETVGMIGVLEDMGKERGKDFQLFEKIEDIQEKDLGTGFDWTVRSQTTLMPSETKLMEEALSAKYPDIFIPDRFGICYATYNRQEALDDLVAKGVQRLVVVGSPHSHNSQMLKRRGELSQVPSYSVDYPEEMKTEWFDGSVKKVGITSGASVLDQYIEPVIDWIKERSPGSEVEFQEQVKREPMDARYPLPKESINALKERYAA